MKTPIAINIKLITLRDIAANPYSPLTPETIDVTAHVKAAIP
jgi:hypothetical protein